MKKEIKIGSLDCHLCKNSEERLVYILYPMNMLSGWIREASVKYGVSIAVITNMDWDDDLTPWPAPGAPKGSPPFKGEAQEFLKQLQTVVMPRIEREMEMTPRYRDLVGVSLSGLFTTWQWVICDTFMNIASLSGSFWYEGFVEWFEENLKARKPGKAYFSLGKREGLTHVPQFKPVVKDTALVVEHIASLGITHEFQSVPGDHYQFPIDRLTLAFNYLYL